jgi:hypothetical protein
MIAENALHRFGARRFFRRFPASGGFFGSDKNRVSFARHL